MKWPVLEVESSAMPVAGKSKGGASGAPGIAAALEVVGRSSTLPAQEVKRRRLRPDIGLSGPDLDRAGCRGDLLWCACPISG